MSDDEREIARGGTRALALLRQWAMHIGTPIFIVDATGSLVFYNEPAQAMLGRRYDLGGSLEVNDLDVRFHTRTLEDLPLPAEDLPIAVALVERRPTHRTIRFRGENATRWVTVDVTAFPLLRRPAHGATGEPELLGAVALFWPSDQPL